MCICHRMLLSEGEYDKKQSRCVIYKVNRVQKGERERVNSRSRSNIDRDTDRVVG